MTLGALIALRRTSCLRSQIPFALQRGVTKEDLVELITHLAMSVEWDCAREAKAVAEAVAPEFSRMNSPMVESVVNRT